MENDGVAAWRKIPFAVANRNKRDLRWGGVLYPSSLVKDSFCCDLKCCGGIAWRRYGGCTDCRSSKLQVSRDGVPLAFGIGGDARLLHRRVEISEEMD